MPRNKYPEETVDKIVNASMKLFIEKGYEKTTVLDIVENLGGLTRGAFYHHFKSKEDVLHIILSRLNNLTNEAFRLTSKNKLSGLEKFREYIKAEQKLISTPAYRDMIISAVSLTRDPRFLVEKVLIDKISAQEFLQPLIKEGIKDGSIESQDAKYLAEFTLLVTDFWLSPVIYHCTKEETESKLLFIKRLFKNIGYDIFDDELYHVILNFIQTLNENIAPAPFGTFSKQLLNEKED